MTGGETGHHRREISQAKRKESGRLRLCMTTRGESECSGMNGRVRDRSSDEGGESAAGGGGRAVDPADVVIEGQRAARHHLGAEFFAHAAAGRSAVAGAEKRIVEQVIEGLGEWG